jgi:hypothetical protein
VRTVSVYSDIDVVVQIDGGVRDAVNLAESLQRPTKARHRAIR